ncbi:MAG: hypothetical protein ACYSUX_07715 [Planctomycetota bacterium]
MLYQLSYLPVRIRSQLLSTNLTEKTDIASKIGYNFNEFKRNKYYVIEHYRFFTFALLWFFFIYLLYGEGGLVNNLIDAFNFGWDAENNAVAALIAGLKKP